MTAMARLPGRPSSPASLVCEEAIELRVWIDEGFRQHGTRLWEAALLLGDYPVLSEAHALAGTRKAMRTQLRRIAGMADGIYTCADGHAPRMGHGRAS